MKRDLNFFLIKFNCLLFTFFYCLLSEFLPVICLIWQTLTARDDTRTRQHVRKQEIRVKMASLDSIFFAGENK